MTRVTSFATRVQAVPYSRSPNCRVDLSRQDRDQIEDRTLALAQTLTPNPSPDPNPHPHPHPNPLTLTLTLTLALRRQDFEQIEDLMTQRHAAKRRRAFQRADELQVELRALGVETDDKAREWRIA